MRDQVKNDGQERKDEIFSKAVRAGKRTYFFDVKATRNNDYYLTLTESKKIHDGEGKFHFEKHKVFLYREDFEKFVDGLHEAVEYIKENSEEPVKKKEEAVFTDVNFDDLNS